MVAIQALDDEGAGTLAQEYQHQGQSAAQEIFAERLDTISPLHFIPPLGMQVPAIGWFSLIIK